MTPEERILALKRQLQALEIQERDMHLRRLQIMKQEWSTITGQNPDAPGCECCGPPHAFWADLILTPVTITAPTSKPISRIPRIIMDSEDE